MDIGVVECTIGVHQDLRALALNLFKLRHQAVWSRWWRFMRLLLALPSRNLKLLFLEQVMVSVACNGAHSLKQRLARWLLMMRDRSDSDVPPITQSLLGEMLGVQRPSITNAVRELERAGLIEHGRRQVTILDRRGLTKVSCECYHLVRARVAFHLPKTYE
jgi:CRP-like cAMP-binding protein